MVNFLVIIIQILEGSNPSFIFMFNLINQFVNYFHFNSVCFSACIFFSSSIVFYYYSYKKVSFLLLYITLTCTYFVVLSSGGVYSLVITYLYYFLVFIFYHLYFTVSKRFYSRTVVVIRGYLRSSEHLKLFLWIVLVFISSLFGGEIFIFLMVFSPLLSLSLMVANFKVFFFLLIQWIWILGLVFSNRFSIFTDSLSSIRDYFSRRACLHYIGNNTGSKISPLGLAALMPLGMGIPAFGGYALNVEAQTGNYAIEKMHDFQAKHPKSTHTQQYAVYSKYYLAHANSSIAGRGLTKWGVMVPGAPEAVIPDFKTQLQDALNKSNK